MFVLWKSTVLGFWFNMIRTRISPLWCIDICWLFIRALNLLFWMMLMKGDLLPFHWLGLLWDLYSYWRILRRFREWTILELYLYFVWRGLISQWLEGFLVFWRTLLEERIIIFILNDWAVAYIAYLRLHIFWKFYFFSISKYPWSCLDVDMSARYSLSLTFSFFTQINWIMIL